MIFQTYRGDFGQERLLTLEVEVTDLGDGTPWFDDYAKVIEVEGESIISAGDVIELTSDERDEISQQAYDEAAEAAKERGCDDLDDYNDEPYSESYSLHDDGPMHYTSKHPEYER